MKIDLHTHTYFSDGSLSPTEVVDMALKRKVRYLAITDHDVISGVNEAIKHAEDKNIIIIPGIEITSKVECSNDLIHILGLFLNLDYPPLKELSSVIIKSKIIKTEKRLDLANKLFKMNLTLKDIEKKTRGVPGMPHIAMVLLDKEYVRTIQEGIKLFTKGGPCYFEMKDITTEAKKAIEIIHGAGGKAILAHLAAYKNENKYVSYEQQEELIKELIKYGIDGIEVYIPELSEQDKQFGENMIKKYNLFISGGSDFHDEKFIPQNKLGFIDTEDYDITILKVN